MSKRKAYMFAGLIAVGVLALVAWLFVATFSSDDDAENEPWDTLASSEEAQQAAVDVCTTFVADGRENEEAEYAAYSLGFMDEEGQPGEVAQALGQWVEVGGDSERTAVHAACDGLVR